MKHGIWLEKNLFNRLIKTLFTAHIFFLCVCSNNLLWQTYWSKVSSSNLNDQKLHRVGTFEQKLFSILKMFSKRKEKQPKNLQRTVIHAIPWIFMKSILRTSNFHQLSKSNLSVITLWTFFKIFVQSLVKNKTLKISRFLFIQFWFLDIMTFKRSTIAFYMFYKR